jgi:hypothetical protein
MSQNEEYSLPHLKALVERMGEPMDGVLGVIVPKIRPLVTIEQYFKGSNGRASLWDNNGGPPPGVDEAAFWKALRDREDVWDVLFSLTQLEFMSEPFDAPWAWVNSDHVVVITSAQPEDVLSWFPEGRVPELVNDRWAEDGEFSERVFVPSTMKPLWLWYD